MNSLRPFVLLCLVAGAAMGASLPAEAQQPLQQQPRPERPYRGLFGGGAGETEQLLTVSASAGGGYDDNILIDQPGLNGDPRFAKSGTVGTFNGSASYTLDRPRISFGVGGSSSSRYYPSEDTQRLVSGQFADAHATIKLSRRSSFQVSQSVSYQPYSFVSILPTVFAPPIGQAPSETLEIGTPGTAYLADQPYLTYQTGVGFQQELSRRVSLTLGYDTAYSETAYVDGDFRTQYGRAGVRFALTKNLGLRLGYGYTEGQYSAGRRSHTSNIDAGVDYNRALSFSRRTTISFSTGSTVLTDDQGNDRFEVTGAARLNHEIGRSWQAWAAYNRQVSFIDALLTPALTDSLGAGFGGLFNRRVQWQTAVTALIGALGASNIAGRSFDTYQGTTSLQVALMRNLSLNTSYSYYHYRYDTGVILPPGVARNIDRQSVQTSISVWAPLFSRARRTNAAR